MINSDFRDCLTIILAFEDDELTLQEKHQIILSIFYPKCPDDIQGALEQFNLFLNGNEKSNENIEAQPRFYSFNKDAKFIFSAFRQLHGIDLDTTDLHWWKFCALFVGLFGSETPFGSLVGLRQRIKNGTATKEEKRAAREMGDAFEVPEPDTRTLEEKNQEAEFMRLIGNSK